MDKNPEASSNSHDGDLNSPRRNGSKFLPYSHYSITPEEGGRVGPAGLIT
jgi:hypothetical protein